jgi:hypothetical protein
MQSLGIKASTCKFRGSITFFSLSLSLSPHGGDPKVNTLCSLTKPGNLLSDYRKGISLC